MVFVLKNDYNFHYNAVSCRCCSLPASILLVRMQFSWCMFVCLFVLRLNVNACIALWRYFRFAPQFLVATIHSFPFTWRISKLCLALGFQQWMKWMNEQAFYLFALCSSKSRKMANAKSKHYTNKHQTKERNRVYNKKKTIRISYRQIQLQ